MFGSSIRNLSSSRVIQMSSTSATTPSTIHRVARSGFDASGANGLYDRARPTYPTEAISTILQQATRQDGSPLRIVELGAGTGIATRMLLTQATTPSHDGTPPPGILSYRAIEPSAGMRSHFENSIVSGDSSVVQTMKQKGYLDSNFDITIKDGTFEKFDAGNQNDVVVIAQTWHWCQDFEKALEQIAQSLRPGGILALIWNLEERENTKWVAQLRDLYERYEDNTPQYRHMYWHSMYSTRSISTFFEPPLPPLEFHRAIPTTLQGVKDRILSKSYISVLSKDKQNLLSNQVDEFFASNDDHQLGRTWIDQQNGIWEYPYRTDLHLFRKKANN